MAREKTVDNAVAKILKQRGAWHYKNFSDKRNPAGVPDFIAMYGGKALFIENKKPKGEKSKVSFLQKKHMQAITDQGGVSVLAKSGQFVERVLDAIDSTNQTEELEKLGWNTHGSAEIRDNDWNEETIW